MIVKLIVTIAIVAILGAGASFFAQHQNLAPPILQEAMAPRVTIFEVLATPDRWSNMTIRVAGVVAASDRFSVFGHGAFWLHDAATGLRLMVLSRDGAPAVNTPVEIAGTFKNALEVGALTAGVLIQN